MRSIVSSIGSLPSGAAGRMAMPGVPSRNILRAARDPATNCRRCFNARRTGDALRVARAQLKADAKFKPLKGEDTIKLIELARDGGDRHTARLLLTGFAERYEDAVARKIAGQLAQQLER